MKLNNKGWGTMQMLLLSLGLLIALIVAIIFISQLYGSLDNSKKNSHYFTMENDLVEAAQKYVYLNNINIEEEHNISYYTLKESGLINNFKDEYGNECNGYVRVYKLDFIPQYKSYITCNNYKTYERAY